MNNQGLKTYIFYCSNNFDQDQLAGVCSGLDGITVKTIGLPCSGKIDIPYLVKAFETGADGVVIVSCKQNECRHLEGSLRAQKRAEAVESLLEEIGIGKGRMVVITSEKNDVEQIRAEIRNFFNSIRGLSQQHAQDNAVNLWENTNV